MTLTVRLDDTLESALEQHCASHGVTKSRVVQESLAAYLLAGKSQSIKAAGGQRAVNSSATTTARSNRPA